MKQTNVDTPNTHIHDPPFSSHGTGTSVKNRGGGGSGVDCFE